ncbi:hypothetical protein SOVF_064010 [Spinacia oleracea]|nr:hypothetical protein SOVF_064010 [Spinacia oleracea]
MESKPSDSLKTPEKTSSAMKPKTSDQISSRTPKKLPHPPQRIKYHRRSIRLPEKYEMLLRFFDGLDVSLKLLRLRNAIPVFSKIRVMIENMSERRFTHQHLAQLKFLLPEEIGIKKVLMADGETRCMKHDLHLTMTVNGMTRADKRKRGSELPCLRDHFISKLLGFVGNHPEGTDIPEEKLPEPFNQQKNDLLLNTFKQSNSCSQKQKYSGVAVELEAAQASHFSPSFRKHFSSGGSDSNKSWKSLQSPSESSHQLQSISVLNPSVDRDELASVAHEAETVPYRLRASQIKRKSIVDSETFSAHSGKKKQGTPLKSAGTPIKPATPSLQTPKRFRLNADINSACKASDRPTCARSLQFEGSSRNINIDLQDDEVECSSIVDILPENLLQSIKEKEKRAVELAKRKQMIKCLPKLFDRIYILFRNPKISAVRKEALIRELTECHLDITDESEVEEQLKLLQEIIPDWIICKFSPSGNILYRINKTLDPKTLRLTLDKAI